MELDSKDKQDEMKLDTLREIVRVAQNPKKSKGSKIYFSSNFDVFSVSMMLPIGMIDAQASVELKQCFIKLMMIPSYVEHHLLQP